MTNQHINALPAVNEFYVSSSLYTEYNLNAEEKDEVFKIVFNIEPIDCFCIDCSAYSVFAPEENRSHITYEYGMRVTITSSNKWDANILTDFSIFQLLFDLPMVIDQELMALYSIFLALPLIESWHLDRVHTQQILPH